MKLCQKWQQLAMKNSNTLLKCLANRIISFKSISDVKNVDTKPLRRALQVYVQNLYGYVNEDFDYGTVLIKSLDE